MGVAIHRWAALILMALAFVAAAKAHGRQIRLERERAGFHSVVFGGDNPPFVAALWRSDRIVFWSSAAALLVLYLGYLALAPRLGWRLPLGGGVWTWALVPLAILWPMLGAFVIAGMTSLWRTRRAWLAGAEPSREWIQAMMVGSAGFWGVALGLAAAAFVMSWRE